MQKSYVEIQCLSMACILFLTLITIASLLITKYFLYYLHKKNHHAYYKRTNGDKSTLK